MKNKQQQVRGSELRQAAMESQEKGDRQRTEHQGQDALRENRTRGLDSPEKKKSQNTHQAKKSVWAYFMRNRQ